MTVLKDRMANGERNLTIVNGKIEQKKRDQKLIQGRAVKCFYSNANSVISKMDELRQRSVGCNIVGITESWATSDISDAELHIEGMNMFRRDRKSGIGVELSFTLMSP